MRKLPNLLLASFLLLPAAAFAADLKIAFVDVGQGDATVIIAPSGCAAVIDGGPTGTGANVKAYLQSQGVTQIDFGIATHYHADHIGGLDEVAQGTDGIPFSVMYDRGSSYSSTAYTQYANQFAGIRSTARRGQTFSLCNEVSFEVVSVNGNGAPIKGENGASVGVKISYGAFDALVAGDLVGTTPAIEPTLVGRVGEVEVYKVHHHGSKYSSIDTFLAEILPTVSVIEVGAGNTYGHPTPEAIARLQAVGSTIYQTEDPATKRILGNVVVTTAAGASYTVTQGGTSTPFASKGGGPDTSPPTAPGTVVATASGSSNVVLSWAASTDDVGVTRYRVYRSTQGNPLALASPGRTIPGLTAFRSCWCEATSISLSWIAPADDLGVADYRVLCSPDGTTFTQVGTATTSFWADSGLAGATTVWYVVRAEDAAGNLSGDSNTASATTTPPRRRGR